MKKGVIIGVVSAIIIIAVIAGYFYFNSSNQPKQLIGNEVLEVKVTMNNGVPVPKLEVDLWQAGSSGAPNAGISYTDDNGIAKFNIPDGQYEIGFNLNNFPENLEYPAKTSVVVEKNIPASKTISIISKQEDNQQSESGLILHKADESPFDGIDDFIDISEYLNDVKNLGEGTIAFSFKFDSLLDKQTVMPILYMGMDNENDPDNIFIIEIGHFKEGSFGPDPSNKKIYTTWIKDNKDPFLCFDSNENLQDNVWYDFAVVVDNNGNTGYLNGAELTNRNYNFGSSSAGYFLNSIPAPEKLWIGKGRSSFQVSPKFVYFKGSIKDLRIYNKALTKEEIAKL